MNMKGAEHSSARLERFLQMSNDDADTFPVSEIVISCDIDISLSMPNRI